MKKVIIIVGITCFFIVMIACNNFGQQNKLQDFDRNQKPSLIPINTDDLRGLKIEAFCNKAFHKIAARTPQYIAEEGLCKTFGIRNNKLNNLSDSYNSQTNKLAAQISELLSGYDKETCEPSQQITKGVLQWYIDDMLSGHKYRFHSYPVNQLFFGYHNYLPLYFKTYIAITNKEEAKDYISCLQQINGQVVDLIEGLKHREELGIILPKQIMDIVLGDLQSFLSEESLLDKFHTPLDEQISGLEIDSATKESLLVMAKTTIQSSVLPAYKTLHNYLSTLSPQAKTTIGCSYLPDGKEYYKYMLKHFTTTSLEPEEIYTIGMIELKRIKKEMHALFNTLGYDTTLSLESLYNRVLNDAGYTYGEDIKTKYETLIEKAQAYYQPVFSIYPKAKVVIMPHPDGGFYMSPAPDGSRPGAFFARLSGSKSNYNMPSLLYHETVPGHHFQLAITLESDLPLIRKHVPFIAYSEGWALYAERLMHERGAYEKDIYGKLGQLEFEAFRAARLVVDVGIHWKKWDYTKATTEFSNHTGFNRYRAQYEVNRYIIWPGQATSYMIGMLKILEFRKKAEEQLGENFDIREFHTVILQSGGMPLSILEEVVNQYIKSKVQLIF